MVSLSVVAHVLIFSLLAFVWWSSVLVGVLVVLVELRVQSDVIGGIKLAIDSAGL